MCLKITVYIPASDQGGHRQLCSCQPQPPQVRRVGDCCVQGQRFDFMILVGLFQLSCDSMASPQDVNLWLGVCHPTEGQRAATQQLDTQPKESSALHGHSSDIEVSSSKLQKWHQCYLQTHASGLCCWITSTCVSQAIVTCNFAYNYFYLLTIYTPYSCWRCLCKVNYFEVALTERYKAADHADLAPHSCVQIIYKEPRGNSYCYSAEQLKQFKIHFLRTHRLMASHGLTLCFI